MSLLRGLQWVPGVEAVEIQEATGLQIDSPPPPLILVKQKSTLPNRIRGG